MKLNYKRLGEGEPLVILHGLMGMLDNWMSLARAYAEHFDIIVVDARNHGHSPWSDTHNYTEMMHDLEELLDDLHLTEVNLLGHSMGGKTVMKFAQNFPMMMNKLIVADIAPKEYPIHHHVIMEALRSVPLTELEKRTDADDYLAKHIDEPGIRAFLMKSLYWKEKGVLSWRFNLNVLSDSLPVIGEAICDAPFSGDTLFIRGAKSNYIQDDDWADIEPVFHHAKLVTLQNAGHWLHAEQREKFLKETLDFLLN